MRIEAVGEAGDGRRVVTARENVPETVRAKRAEWKGRKKRDVVRRERARTDPLERRGKQAHAKAMIREGQRAGRGPVKRYVPELHGERTMVGDTPADTHSEQRV